MPASSALAKSTNVRSPEEAIRAIMPLLEAASPALTARIVAWLFRKPTRHDRPNREYGWLLGSQPLSVRVDGNEVRAWTWGEGPPVLLVHGWSGRGSQMGAFVEPLVRQGHQVIALDGPAHGESGGWLTTPPQFAKALHAVQRLVGPFEAVVAHSFGTLVTQVAMSQGLQSKRLIYVSPANPPSVAAEQAAEMVGVGSGVMQRVERLLDGLGPMSFRQVDAMTREFDPGVPTLILHDHTDQVVEMSVAEELAARLSYAQLVKTDGLGHYRILRDRALVRQVAAFITGNDDDDWLTPLERELERAGIA